MSVCTHGGVSFLPCPKCEAQLRSAVVKLTSCRWCGAELPVPVSPSLSWELRRFCSEECEQLNDYGTDDSGDYEGPDDEPDRNAGRGA